MACAVLNRNRKGVDMGRLRLVEESLVLLLGLDECFFKEVCVYSKLATVNAGKHADGTYSQSWRIE
jgi:hypothetical protein